MGHAALSNYHRRFIRSMVPSAYLRKYGYPQIPRPSRERRCEYPPGKSTPELFLPHNRWITFSLFTGLYQLKRPLFPQFFPLGRAQYGRSVCTLYPHPLHCVTWYPAWRAGKMSVLSARTMSDGMAVTGTDDGLPRQRKAVNLSSPTPTGGPHVFISVRGCTDNNARTTAS